MPEKYAPQPEISADEEKHPGARGAKVRIPEMPPPTNSPEERKRPIGNGAVDEPAAFPPHN